MAITEHSRLLVCLSGPLDPVTLNSLKGEKKGFGGLCGKAVPKDGSKSKISVQICGKFFAPQQRTRSEGR